MYLAKELINEKLHYWIRRSVLDKETGVYSSHDLFSLGADPGRWIIYTGDRSFHIDEAVSAALEKVGAKVSISALEDVFFPFLRRDIREVVDRFRKHGRRSPARLSAVDKVAIEKLHIFDKRRMHYLYYGAVDQSRLGRAPLKLFRKLVGKSRDEIEQLFIDLETRLPGDESCQYIYTIFDLQRFFTENFARTMPEALDRRKIDEYFIREVNHLREDHSFWVGMAREEAVHYYLGRYVARHFNSQFSAGAGWEEYIRNFMNGHRQHVQPRRNRAEVLSEAAAQFKVDGESLQKMSKRELTRLYRKKAHEHHPDKGGEHDEFVRLTELYQELVKGK